MNHVFCFIFQWAFSIQCFFKELNCLKINLKAILDPHIFSHLPVEKTKKRNANNIHIAHPPPPLIRVGAKYIGTCTYLFLSTSFQVLACTLYLSIKNVLVLVPKYITTYLVIEDKYIAITSRFVPKIYIIIYFFSYSVQYFFRNIN